MCSTNRIRSRMSWLGYALISYASNATHYSLSSFGLCYIRSIESGFTAAFPSDAFVDFGKSGKKNLFCNILKFEKKLE